MSKFIYCLCCMIMFSLIFCIAIGGLAWLLSLIVPFALKNVLIVIAIFGAGVGGWFSLLDFGH